MKILLFSQYYPPEVGATQTRLHHFATCLAEHGHAVSVVTEVPNHPKGVIFEGYSRRFILRSKENGVEVIRVWVYASPKKSFVRRLIFYGSYLLNSILAGLIVTRGQFDVVFASSPPLPVGISGYLVSRLKRCSFVLDIRDIWPAVGVVLGEIRGQYFIRAAERLESFLYNKADAITCVTRSFVEQIAEKKGSAEEVHFLPNGTLPEIFDPTDQDESLRSRFGGEDKFVVSFCGNHGVAQGLETVIKAAKLLKDNGRFRFVFVGEGPVKSKLEKMTADLLLPNVDFLPQVPIKEIAAYINASDVSLVPLKKNPIFNGFIPSKMFDLMCCGKPVILSVPGEARQILEESGGGVYVEPDNAEALAEALVELSKNPASLAEMGRSGRNYVLRHFLRDEQVDKLEKLFARLISD